jgi:outer membrane protein assembly factor BamB
LRILNQEDGQLPPDVDPEQYWQIQPGNMAFGNSCLAVADQERLYVYVPPGRLLEERRKDAAAHPNSAPAHYRLAVAEADAGLALLARDDFARAERLAKPEERCEGFHLRNLARSERHRLLLALAQRAATARQEPRPPASGYLEEASATEFSTSERLQAFRRKAEWLAEAHEPVQGVAVWQAILDDEALRAGQMLDGHGSPQQAACYAAEQISGLIKANGAGVYKAVEERALAELNSVPENRRSEVLIQLGRRFPNASIIRSALLQDGAAQEKAGRQAIAAQEYRSLLALTEYDQTRTPALEGLDRIYQEQRHQEAARSTPELKLPLVPRSEMSLSAHEHLVGPVSPQATHLFFAAGTQLTCRKFCRNDTCWKRTLSDCPCWVGTHADLVIVAGTQSIHCLHKADGRELWRFADPALPTLVLSNGSDRGNECSFCQFHLTGGLLFFLQGNRQLFAIDVETGRVLWTRWAPGAQIRSSPPGGEFVRHFHADANRVVVQTSAGRCLMLDSLTGRVVAEFSSNGDLWPQPPLDVGDRQICMVAGSRQISSLDLPTGRELWRIQAPLPGITTQPPQLLGDGKMLLCLVDGWQLFRLDPSNGQTLWKRGTGTEPLSMDHIAFDQEGVYYVSRNVLHARSLSDGRPLWSLDLPNSSVPWKAVAAGDYLLVFPSQAPHQLRWGIFLGSHPMSFPMEVRWDKFPVLICDKKEGKVVQRMVFLGEGSQAAVHCFGKGLAIVVGEKIHAYFGQETAKENARSGAEGAQRAPK